MARIKKQNSEIELARFHPNDAELLLQFNITKQRIVDLCNQEFEDDPFDQGKNYSSWHRALDGQEVWEGIVQALDGLYEDQIAHPRKYLPTNDPGDDLREWMAQIAKATWWHKTLKLDLSLNTLNSWFSGRVSKTRPELREQVDAWWARVKSAADMAERYSAVAMRDKIAHDDRERDTEWDNAEPSIGSWDTWCKDLLEDGLSVDEVRERFVSEGLLYDQHYLKLIDLADPQSPLTEGYVHEHQEGWRRQQFDELAEAGFPLALSRTPPEFDPTPFAREAKWGDRRDEEGPKDLNTHLYGKHYRQQCVRRWDDSERRVVVDAEIVEVSKDGKNWRPATELEKQGWQNGIYFWEKALIEGHDTSNSYTQELEAAKIKERRARRAWESCDQDLPLNRNLKIAFREAERDLQVALDNTLGQYD